MITLLNFHTGERWQQGDLPSAALSFFPLFLGVHVLALCPAASDSGGQSSSLGERLI